MNADLSICFNPTSAAGLFDVSFGVSKPRRTALRIVLPIDGKPSREKALAALDAAAAKGVKRAVLVKEALSL